MLTPCALHAHSMCSACSFHVLSYFMCARPPAHQHTSSSRPVQVTLVDATGIGAGASGVSGGLLHPFSPKGTYFCPMLVLPNAIPHIPAFPPHPSPIPFPHSLPFHARPPPLPFSAPPRAAAVEGRGVFFLSGRKNHITQTPPPLSTLLGRLHWRGEEGWRCTLELLAVVEGELRLFALLPFPILRPYTPVLSAHSIFSRPPPPQPRRAAAVEGRGGVAVHPRATSSGGGGAQAEGRGGGGGGGRGGRGGGKQRVGWVGGRRGGGAGRGRTQALPYLAQPALPTSSPHPSAHPSCAMLVPEALTIHPRVYLKSLWGACVRFASEAAAGGTSAPSLLGSTWVSARAPHRIAVGATNHNLPLPPVPFTSDPSFPHSTSTSTSTTTTTNTPSPSPFAPFPPPPPDEIAAASATLVTSLTSLLPALSSWEVVRSVTGIRAMPPRSSLGRVPVAGRVEGVLLGVVGGGSKGRNGGGEEVGRGRALGGSECAGEEGVEDGGVAGVEGGGVALAAPAAQPGPSVWIVGGLGSRGLIYHGWVAKHAAAAAVGGDEGLLPPELLWWKQQGGKSKVERGRGKEPRRNDGRKEGRGGKSDSG
ncbi:unnamed protein product [Closterium sp. NIES-64]|nr:unnamed protein product [Closterium sp. NIES-64]